MIERGPVLVNLKLKFLLRAAIHGLTKIYFWIDAKSTPALVAITILTVKISWGSVRR